MILMVWNKTDGTYTHSSKRTVWIAMNAELPLECDLEFAKPEDAASYLLILSCVRGLEKGDDRMPPDKNLRVLEAGSFDQDEIDAYDSCCLEMADRQQTIHRVTAEEEFIEMKKSAE